MGTLFEYFLTRMRRTLLPGKIYRAARKREGKTRKKGLVSGDEGISGSPQR